MSEKLKTKTEKNCGVCEFAFPLGMAVNYVFCTRQNGKVLRTEKKICEWFEIAEREC